jgi:hypothetical protein
MFIRPLLFKTRHEFIFQRKNSAQASDIKPKTKMTPAMLQRQISVQNKFSGEDIDVRQRKGRHLFEDAATF